VLENAVALAIEERVFGERGELIRVGVRTGVLVPSQLRAQRVGGDWFHDADPSLL
jgi:hypothetical protein